MTSRPEIVVVGMARTPFGSFQGALATVPAHQLGSVAIQGAIQRSGVKPEQVSEVIMGCILTAGQGQAPARQAGLGAGIPDSVPAMTLNKVCGSGMKSVMLGMQSLMVGDSEVVVAGGMENMTQAPYLSLEARAGLRMGNTKFIDSMIHDALWDPYGDKHMGNCAELCASEYRFTREQQDAYAIESFKRAQEAQKQGKFKNEIVPVTIKSKQGDVVVEQDEGPMKAKFDKIPQLKPVFQKDGTVTAANASTINDGAAAFVLTTAEHAKKMGWKPLAKLVSYGTHAQKPDWFTTAPAGAMRQAMKRAGWDAKDVDLFEVNEAFAVVAMAAQKDLGIPHEKINVMGGAISIGHPVGASGARIIQTLITALKDRGLKKGVAGICIGGGEGTAMCVELI